MNNSLPLISAQSVTVKDGNKSVLKNISLKVLPNDNITIIGPNGAGKSLLLKTLLGIIKPCDGIVKRKNNLKIGYMPQQIKLNHLLPMSVKRFLQLTKANNKTIISTLSEVGAENILQNSLHLLSGGQMQRILLARALLTNPDILILDEPAQSLDISGQIAIYRLIEKIKKERNCAILMVSHDLHLVMRGTSKVICLFHHICCSGTPETIAKDSSFTSLFGEELGDILAYYPHTHNHKHDDKCLTEIELTEKDKR